MKSIWTWILVIFFILLVFAAVGIAAQGLYDPRATRLAQGSDEYSPRVEDFERDGFRGLRYDQDRLDMPRPSIDQRMSHFSSWGYDRGSYTPYGLLPLPFIFFGELMRLIIPLGILVLVTYFAYLKGRQDGALEAQLAVYQEKDIANKKA